MCQVQPVTGLELYTHFSIFCTSGREVSPYGFYSNQVINLMENARGTHDLIILFFLNCKSLWQCFLVFGHTEYSLCLYNLHIYRIFILHCFHLLHSNPPFHVNTHLWRTWYMSTASKLETQYPGFCTRGGTSSTTLVFLKVTPTMTLKVKIHTCVVSESSYPHRLKPNCPFSPPSNCLCSPSKYLHSYQKQHRWDGH